MLTFTKKTKATQQTPSLKSPRPGRPYVVQNHDKHSIFHLQRTMGNQTVQGLFQNATRNIAADSTSSKSTEFPGDREQIDSPPGRRNTIQSKLIINAPGDRYEQEADQVANNVLRVNPPVETDEKLAIQTKPSAPAAGGERNVSNHIENRLNRSRGSGSPLSPASQSFFEARMRHDFSNVRIHTDDKANQMNSDLGARAFTCGPNIYFQTGQYNPQSTEGMKLLAHELTHVVQQNRNRETPAIQRWLWSSTPPEGVITLEETEESRPLPGPNVVSRPAETAEGRTYTLASEEEYSDLLRNCNASINRTVPLVRLLEARNDEDTRLDSLASVYTQLLSLRNDITRQQPRSVEALQRLAGRLEVLNERQEQMGREVIREMLPTETTSTRPDTREIESRLRDNLRRFERRLELLQMIVNDMRQRGGNVEGVQRGMQLIRVLQVIQAIRSADFVTLSGEAMGLIGEAGPFVGSSGGTAATVTELITNSDLTTQLGWRDAWVNCTVNESASPTECLLLAREAASDPQAFLNEIQRLAQQIENDGIMLRSLRQQQRAGQ